MRPTTKKRRFLQQPDADRGHQEGESDLTVSLHSDKSVALWEQHKERNNEETRKGQTSHCTGKLYDQLIMMYKLALAWSGDTLIVDAAVHVASLICDNVAENANITLSWSAQ